MLRSDIVRGEGRVATARRAQRRCGEGRMTKVVRRCSYLDVEEVCDGVLSKEASNLEEGAGTIWGFNPP